MTGGDEANASSWISRNGSAAEVYSVRSGGKKFLHADARGNAVQIGREVVWPLKEFPILQWRWRAVLFPRTGTKKTTNDSVTGLYVVFGKWPFIKAIKYIWSKLCQSHLSGVASSSAKMVVLEADRPRGTLGSGKEGRPGGFSSSLRRQGGCADGTGHRAAHGLRQYEFPCHRGLWGHRNNRRRPKLTRAG